jgi:hypothetical protein
LLQICERFKSQEIMVGVFQTFHSIFLELQAGDLQRMAIVEANTLIFVMELSAGENQPLQKAQHWGLFTNLIGSCFVSWGESCKQEHGCRAGSLSKSFEL